MVRLVKEKKGVTLIELIVSLALVSIVIVAVVNLFLYNNRIFNKSNEMSQVQFDVRMASDMLTENLRNINTISLTNNTLSKKIGLAELQSSYPLISSINFTIRSESSKIIVNYEIIGRDTTGKNQYSLISEVMLNNIKSEIYGTSNVIYYGN